MKIIRKATEVPRSRLRIVKSAPSSRTVVPPTSGTPESGSRDLDGFWHLHAHSQYSVKDAISPVEQMIETVVRHEQTALALTDHGNMGGVVQLYQGAKKHGIVPFPGVEAYLVRDKGEKKAKRFHVGMVSFTTEGYEALVRIQSEANKRENFSHKPLVDLNDMAEWFERGWTEGIALTTGCYFGLPVQMLVTEGYDTAKRVLQMYRAWFPHTYVEVQQHYIDHEDGWNDWKVGDYLTMLASELGLPMVITNDAHYCDLEEKELHEHLKRLVAFGPDPDDAVFPGDGFHLCHEDWIRDHHGKVQYEQGIEGLRDLLHKHTLVIPELEKYHYNVPATVKDPLKQIKDLCLQQVIDMEGRYFLRFEEELEVIEASGMAGYLWLVKEICDQIDKMGIERMARGSASGSLVCYLLGITEVDPLKWGLRFDRFLSKDRTKPPDIDIDVEAERRGEILEWLDQRFNVCHIGTYGTFGADEESGRGSLLVAYLSKIRKTDPDLANSIKGLADIPASDRKHLLELSDQGVRKSYGTHAGGLVITSTADEFDRLVPTMLVASSNTTVTQFEMDDIEALGYVKLDLLGNRNLTTFRRSRELAGVSRDDIELRDARSYTMLRQGRTTGVFQMEGWTASKGCKETKVKTLKDVINILAVYRPGVMNSGGKDAFVRRKFGQEKVTYLHPLLEKHFKATYGIPIYQEQTVGLLRELGFNAEDLTKFLKAVKASNKKVEGAQKVIASYREQFIAMATEAGFDDEAIAWTWNTIEGFAEYGFNKAHAVSYGYLAARMAYLKTHHPLEFATALLESAYDDKRIKDYLKMVRRELGISILKPDINISGPYYDLDHRLGAIRRGFVTIKGVGEKAAQAIVSERERGGEYKSVEDLVERLIEAGETRTVTGLKSYPKEMKGVLGRLDEVGVLDSIK